MDYTNINKDLMLGFIDESLDALSDVDNLSVELEKKPQDREIINAIFRPIHSLKGNAAYFGLMKLKKLAHTLENLLDRLRKGSRKVDGKVISSMLPGIDQLKEILINVRENKDEISDEIKYSLLLSKIEGQIDNPAIVENSGDFLADINLLIGDLKNTLKGPDAERFDKLVQKLKNIPPLSGLTKDESALKSTQEKTQDRIHHLADTLSERLLSISNTDINSQNIDTLHALLGELGVMCVTENQKCVLHDITDILETFVNSDAGIDDLAKSLILEKLLTLKNGSGANLSQNLETGEDHGAITFHDQKFKTDKTMRIPEKALDDFLRSVGELLGIEEMLRHLQRKCIEGYDSAQLQANLKEAIGQFEAISGELRSRIMEIRKVEAKVLLQKVPRIVRDIAASKEKKINVVCIGETVAVDKSYIDILDAPLTHMIRNAADHGIEVPAVRINKGKHEIGNVTVSLTENEDVLKLTVQDDGAGLNYDGLQRKAVELGLIEKNNPITVDQITELLFFSGVSTASEVTDISGRGVGMDIVKRAISEAGGKVEVESSAGIGTTFTISLPRNASTQIIDGYVVQSFSGEIYVVPLGNVIEAFRIEPQEINSVAGKSTMLQRRGTFNPLYTLDILLGLISKNIPEKEPDRCMGILIETKKNRSVIAVREIIGIQKVVSKRIEGGLLESTQFDGAAVSGTGQIYMIINVEKLFD